MTTSIKITALTPIGANIAYTTLVPVVNMTGTPTTQKATAQVLGNLILNGAGGSYFPAAAQAVLAGTVTTAAQPNITSVGTLTTLAVTGSASISGNITSNGTAYLGNISTTGDASITTLQVGATANLGAVGNVKITGGTVGQVLSTDGSGNLSWVSDATTYGNSNVVSLLSAFGSNTITTTGNISGGNLVTGGQVVASGNVSSGTGLSTGGFLSVDGNTDLHNTVVTGNLSATGNITANNLGNISAINLTGSNANVLYGNGVFAPVAGGNGTYGDSNVVTLLSAFGSNTITTTGNVSVGNIIGNSTINIDNRDSGNAADIQLFAADDIVLQARDRTLGSTSEGGDINIFAGDSAEDSDSSGGDVVIEAGAGGAANVDFGGSGGFITIQSGRGGAAIGNSGYSAENGGDLTLSAGDAGDNNGNIDLGSAGGDVFIESGFSTGNTDYGGEIVLTTGTGGQNAASGNVRIVIPGYGLTTGGTWKFDGTGNLTLPGNTFAVNYANGTAVSIGGGGANTGNVTFSDQIILGTGTNDGGGGLYLAPGNASIANSAVQYLRVRGGDAPTHIHLDTGNNEFYDQYFGDDGKFVKLEAGGFGNVVIGTIDIGNNYNWSFTTDGNLILAGGNSVIQSIANSSLDPTLPNVSTMVLTPDQNYNSQVLVLDPTAPGHIHLRAYAFSNIDEPAANIFLGGEDTAFEVTSGANNEVRVHSGGNTWTFDNTGNLIFPRDAVSNIDPILSIVSGATPTIVSTDASLTGPANLAIQSNYLNLSGFTGEKITFFPDDGLIATDYDMVLTTNVGGGNTYTWTLDATGNLNLPGNLVIAGNTSVFGTNASLLQTTDDRPLLALSSGANGAVSSLWVEDIGNVGTSNIAAVYANPTVGSGIVRIAVGQNGNAGPNLWDFGADGRLTFPGTPRIDTDANNFEVQAAEAINFEANTVVNIYTDAGNNAFQWQFGDDGNLIIPGTGGGFIKTISNASIGIAAMDNGTNNPAQLLSINAGSGAATSIVSAYATNATIQTNAAGNINTWSFDNAGNLTLPTGGQIIVSGGLVSSGASPAPTINGFSITNSVGISGNGNIAGNNISATGTLTSTGKIGYASGSTVTQSTGRGNGVTINALAGTIITTSAAMVANEIDTFSVINSSVDPNNDIVLAQIVSPNLGTYNCIAGPAIIGGFDNGFYINIVNISGFTTSDEALTIRFMVIKAPNA